jgi:hypothetical protein
LFFLSARRVNSSSSGLSSTSSMVLWFMSAFQLASGMIKNAHPGIVK